MADNKTVGGGFASGVINESLYAIPELFGFKPPVAHEQFRAEHPYASFGASLLVSAIPYAGWFKASQKIKRFDALVKGIGDVKKAPFLTGAAQTAARFAPLEAARVGVNAAFGDTPNSEMLTSALTNELVGGFLGGAGEWIMAGGKRVKKLSQLTNIDGSAPVQLQLRALDKHIADTVPDTTTAPDLMNHRAKLREQVRAQVLDPKTAYYVAPLESGDHKAVLNLFDNNSDAKSIVRKRFVDSSKDFTTPGSWQQTADRAGLPADFEKTAQYPRYVAFKGQSANQFAVKTEQNLTSNLAQVGDNWLMGKEKNDGLYVMARKFTGQLGTPSPHDEWIVFKTDTPELFATKPHGVAKAFSDLNWEPTQKITSMDMGEIGNKILTLDRNMPKNNWEIIQDAKGAGAKAFDKIKELAGVKSSNNELEVVARLRDWMKTYLQPSMFQFRNSASASRILSMVRMAADHAEAQTDKFVHGVYQAPASGANLMNESLKSASNLNKQNALRAWTHDPKKLTDQDLLTANNLWKNQATPKQISDAFSTGQLSKSGHEFMQLLVKQNEAQMADVNKVRKSVGLSEVSLREGHFGISRNWNGDQMIALRDSGGALVDIAAGFNNRDAQKNAQLLLARNPKLRIAENFDRSRTEGLPRDLTNAVNAPAWSKERSGVGGYNFDLQPWTRDELLQTLEENIRSRNKYQAEASVREIIKPELTKLLTSDPDTAKMLMTRIDDVFGKQRPLGVIQNTITDKILAPMLGKNSASTIVSTTNSALWHLNLGGMHLGFVVQNALGVLQTVMPEIAFQLNGSLRGRSQYYSHFAAGGAGGPVGTLSVLDPMKIMASAFKQMRNPPESLLRVYEQGVQERIVGSKITEEYVGESATKIRDLRTAFNSVGGFGSWIRAVSEFLPAQTERFTRAYALSVGHVIGKEMLGLEGEALYRHAKETVVRTNYLYGAADRPGMFTTPAGAVFGQFKNWMMHYMHTMAEYTGEGFAKGNWSPLLWQQAGTWAVGGLAASPLINVADSVNGMFSDKSTLENTYETFGTRGADGIYYGLPALLGGVSLSSQTTTPFTNPARDAEMLYSFVLMDRVKNLGSTMGAAMDAWKATGAHPGKNDHFRDLLIRTFAPKTIYRTMQVIQDKNINSLQNGYPVIKDVGMFDKMLYAAGIPPAEIERNFAISDMLWKQKEERGRVVASLGEAYYEATNRNDTHMLSMLLRKSQLEGVTSSMLASAQSRRDKSNLDSMQRNFGRNTALRFSKLGE